MYYPVPRLTMCSTGYGRCSSSGVGCIEDPTTATTDPYIPSIVPFAISSTDPVSQEHPCHPILLHPVRTSLPSSFATYLYLNSSKIASALRGFSTPIISQIISSQNCVIGLAWVLRPVEEKLPASFPSSSLPFLRLDLRCSGCRSRSFSEKNNKRWFALLSRCLLPCRVRFTRTSDRYLYLTTAYCRFWFLRWPQPPRRSRCVGFCYPSPRQVRLLEET